MRIFCDTSVLIPATVPALPEHAKAFAVIERVQKGKDEGFIGLHTLAELYSSLTRLPVNPRIQPGEAASIIKVGVLKHFKVQTLGQSEYLAIIEKSSITGLIGGTVYDALLLGCAEKVKPDRIYTYNLSHFKRIAPHLSAIISAP